MFHAKAQRRQGDEWGDLVVASFDNGQPVTNFGEGPISQIVTSRASAEVPLVAHHPPRHPANVLKPDAWLNVKIPLDVAIFSSSGDRPPAPLRLAAAHIDDRRGEELIIATAPTRDCGKINRLSRYDGLHAPGCRCGSFEFQVIDFAGAATVQH